MRSGAMMDIRDACLLRRRGGAEFPPPGSARVGKENERRRAPQAQKRERHGQPEQRDIEAGLTILVAMDHAERAERQGGDLSGNENESASSAV